MFQGFRSRITLVSLMMSWPVTLASAWGDAIVTFDNGTEGWTAPAFVDPVGGNPGANYHAVLPDAFGLTYRTSTNPAFLGDYTLSPTVTLSIDLKVENIDFFGSPVSRPWLVELRDFDDPEPGYPWTSVWYKFTDVSQANTSQWTTFSVTIEDTTAPELPVGWGGTGAETPLGEPILPPDRTFTSVLASVDEVAFTTFEPGFFFGFTNFDVRVDNIAILTLDCPADLSGNGVVDAEDLALLLGDWGPAPGSPGDLSGNGVVDAEDLALLLGSWGPCPGMP